MSRGVEGTGPMRRPSNDDMFEVGASIALGVAVFLVFAIIILTTGCASCPECVAEIETIEVKIPVAVYPEVPDVPALVLPEYPRPPSEVSEGATKDWYAEMVATVRARERLLLGRVELLLGILESFREE